MPLQGVLHNFRKRCDWQGQDARTSVGLPGGVRDAGDAQVFSRGACCARPGRQNAVKPRIECVLTQWKPSFILFRPALPPGPRPRQSCHTPSSDMNTASTPYALVREVPQLLKFALASVPRPLRVCLAA
jgi:hypothetical protein